MSENVMDLRTRAAAALAEAAEAELPNQRERALRSAEIWTKMADLRDRFGVRR
ncbi:MULTISPECIES: hypothetical protein [Pseudomonadati]|jgi:hypothetical protein|uniref:Uncharacterized protein n=1 Tax=Aestuariibaculum lutulentum TaxID=2920935 RepID=A0ABS9RN26_9FLAO|nr:hypothetical protein [Aestuariibaculum lutulentum]MCH4554272.1 hypothetical protein [Aestuariibaculum lutulentum]